MKKTKTKTIRVTKQDIAMGERSSHLNCPVALALKRQHPQRLWNIGHCWIDKNKTMKTTGRVSEFILNFDSNQSVKPFTFRIRL